MTKIEQYRPRLGGAIHDKIPAQFPKSHIERASLATTPVFHLSNDGLNALISHASGFLWRLGSRIFLVTARHVLSGRHPFTGDVISENGYLPNKVKVFPVVSEGDDNWSRREVILNLVDADGVCWVGDPEYESLRTDIAAIELPDPESLQVQCLNDGDGYLSDLLTGVGFECSVVGYPSSEFEGLMTPIWRRGVIASEPLLPVDGKPMFLVDASTSPGFSGAPVFRRHFGPVPIVRDDGQLDILLDRVVTTSFVGVYSGRLTHSHFGGEVPFAFYANRLTPILANI